MEEVLVNHVCGLFYTPANVAIGIQGKSGIGKSSLVAKLLEGRDWKIIGDDPTIFMFDKDRLVVYFNNEQLNSESTRRPGGVDDINYRLPSKDCKKQKFSKVNLPADKIWTPSGGKINLSYMINLHNRNNTISKRNYRKNNYLLDELDLNKDSILPNVQRFKEILYAGRIPIIDVGVKDKNLSDTVKDIEDSLCHMGTQLK